MTASGLVRRLRLARLALHLLAGAAVVAGLFPLLGPSRRLRLQRRWSRELLAILGIRLEVRGEPAAAALLVANHVSWLDIHAINATQPSCFVAKAEVRGWPLIGWLAAKTGTLFIERSRRSHARHIAHEMAALLAAGRSIALFPEGTTTDGTQLLPFHAALLQPAISAGVALQPMAIAYRDAAGRTTTAPAYVGEMSFVDSVRRVVSLAGLTIDLTCLPAMATSGHDRRGLAREGEARVRGALGLAAPAPAELPRAA